MSRECPNCDSRAFDRYFSEIRTEYEAAINVPNALQLSYDEYEAIKAPAWGVLKEKLKLAPEKIVCKKHYYFNLPGW
jgi:hypothetical protein